MESDRAGPDQWVDEPGPWVDEPGQWVEEVEGATEDRGDWSSSEDMYDNDYRSNPWTMGLGRGRTAGAPDYHRRRSSSRPDHTSLDDCEPEWPNRSDRPGRSGPGPAAEHEMEMGDQPAAARRARERRSREGGRPRGLNKPPLLPFARDLGPGPGGGGDSSSGFASRSSSLGRTRFRPLTRDGRAGGLHCRLPGGIQTAKRMAAEWKSHSEDQASGGWSGDETIPPHETIRPAAAQDSEDQASRGRSGYRSVEDRGYSDRGYSEGQASRGPSRDPSWNRRPGPAPPPPPPAGLRVEIAGVRMDWRPEVHYSMLQLVMETMKHIETQAAAAGHPPGAAGSGLRTQGMTGTETHSTAAGSGLRGGRPARHKADLPPPASGPEPKSIAAARSPTAYSFLPVHLEVSTLPSSAWMAILRSEPCRQP